MRACNGCRKRKIKCDAATTNTWPCSACTRLKLVCVPPTIGQENEVSSTQNPESSSLSSLRASQAATSTHHPYSIPQNLANGSQPAVGHATSYNDGVGLLSQYIPSDRGQSNFYEIRPPHLPTSSSNYQHPQMFSATPNQGLENTTTSMFADDEQSTTAENLSEVLGELRIDETGIGEFNHVDYRA